MDRVQLEPEDLQESNVTKRAGYARRVFFHRNTAVVMIHRSFFVAVKEEADLKRKGCLKRLCTVLLAGMLAVSSWSFAFAADEVSGDSSSAAAVEADNTAKGDTGEAEAADKAGCGRQSCGCDRQSCGCDRQSGHGVRSDSGSS